MNLSDTGHIRYGGQGLLRVKQTLKAGRLSVQLMEDGSLRYLTFNGREILRSIYSALRDENWRTIPVELHSVEINQDEHFFAVRIRAVYKAEEGLFEWEGLISGSADGNLRYSMEGTALRDFHKNRLGFCILHPIDIAGTPVEVRTDQGVIHDRFSELITPHDPFTHMQSMKYELEGQTEISIFFEGDLFHMEDQRNWIDASFKTFCTPLDIPYPVKISRNGKVKQSVTVNMKTAQAGQPVIMPATIAMTIQNQAAGKLPKIGTWFAHLDRKASDKELARLRDLRLSQIRTQINLLESGWQDVMRNASDAAGKLGIELETEVLTDHREDRIQSLCSFIHQEQISVSRLSLYPAFYSEEERADTACELTGSSYRACQFTTKRSLLQHAVKYIGLYRLNTAIGGGSRTNFTEFNRTVLPLELMDFAEFALQPQTHASDIDSIVETLEVKSLTVKTAKHILAGCGLPLRINSVTLKPRLNPYATSIEGAFISKEAQTDTRLYSLFGAGWTIGSIRSLSSEDVETVNYYEHAGKLGITDEDGEVLYPVYHVLAELAGFADAELLNVSFDQPMIIEGIALRKGSDIRILIANLQNESKTIQLHTPFPDVASCRMKILDETNYASVVHDLDPWTLSDGCVKAEMGIIEVTLRPFAVCVLNGSECS